MVRVRIPAVGMLLCLVMAVAEAGTIAPETERFDLKQETTQDSWNWHLPNKIVITARVVQEVGQSNQRGSAVFSFRAESVGRGRLEFGTSPELGQVAVEKSSPAREHELRVDNLEPRGTTYYCRFSFQGAKEVWQSPLLSFKTLLRYSYGYSYSPEDAQLHHQPGYPIIITEAVAPQASQVDKILRDVDAQSYLRHILETITRPEMSKMEKVKAIMSFVGHSVHHNPLYMRNETSQSLLRFNRLEGTLKAGYEREALMILELRYSRCGLVEVVTAALCRLIDVEAGFWSPSLDHSSGRVKIDGVWYFADQDVYKKGNSPLLPDGSLPPLDSVMRKENVLLLDTKPGWIDWGTKGGWTLTKEGFLCTGVLGGGQDQSEDGFPSTVFGARVEFPPSLPQALPVTNFSADSVTLEWVGSYDRDNDFREYVLEVGTSPGQTDVGRFRTRDSFYQVKLPHQGAYYWRVTATDAHGAGTPYEGKIFYLSSEEASFNTGDLPQQAGSLSLPKVVASSEGPLLSLDFSDGSLGGFELREDPPDPMDNGMFGTTSLFNITWGQQGRVLYLIDPTNRWLTRKVVRKAWYRPIPGNVEPVHSWELTAQMRTGRSYMAGNSSFPLLYVSDRNNRGRAAGLILMPQSGQVASAVQASGAWHTLESVDPNNQWHTYTVRFNAKSNSVSFMVDGKKIGSDATVAEAITPEGVWLASNAVAEARVWLSRIMVNRLPGA
jgi:hypothetical protein